MEKLAENTLLSYNNNTFLSMATTVSSKQQWKSADVRTAACVCVCVIMTTESQQSTHDRQVLYTWL